MRLAHPSITDSSTRSPPVGEPPRDQDALLGPIGVHAEKDRVDEQRRDVDVVEGATLKRGEALAQFRADPGGGRLRQLP